MSFVEVVVLVAAFIIMMVLYRKADIWVKKLAPKTVKTMNWIGFALGVAGGILWYLSGSGIFMLITFAGVVIYFIFYGYDKMEEQG